jgi:hypothetical protein
MSLQLQERVKTLEAEVAALRAMLLEVVKPPEVATDLCPKCGVKPNKYFHVRSCQGK